MGFELLPIPVGLKEMQNQSAQWLQIRRERPDYVVMWGWGAMNAGAITEAVKTKFPMDKFVGVWWSGHDGRPSTRRRGRQGLQVDLAGRFPMLDAPVMADIKTHVVDAGKSLSNEEEMTGVFYGRGVVISMILAEGIKTAQEMHRHGRDQPPRSCAAGLENLNVTEARSGRAGS